MYRDLSSSPNVQEQALGLFGSQSEEVKFAAAFAVGNICVGNMERYLPLIVSQIKEEPKRRYLLLHSLKEIITRSEKKAELAKVSDDLWQLLVESSESEQEEGTRSVVAECLGKLALTEPSKFLPELQKRLGQPSVHERAVVATAIKYAIVDPTQQHDSLLVPIFAEFHNLLRDQDLVRRKKKHEGGPALLRRF